MKELDELYFILEEKKRIEKQKKELKEKIEQNMSKSNIDKMENEYLKITLVPETVSKSFDMKKFKEKEPDLYSVLSKDYEKETKRKAYLKVTVV